ncbi:MAG TPA: ATP-binding protein [Planctomycetota bacterium]
MDGILQNVTGFAIWGSLAANGVLGCFLAAQAVVDPLRRRRFAAFAAVLGYLVALDFLSIFGFLATSTYEAARVVWGGLHVGAVLWLFGHPPRRAGGVAAGLIALGLGVFAIKPELATTVAFPIGYGIIAWAHRLEYARTRGYASALLVACSTAVALMCALYLPLMATKSPLAMVLGYFHYAAVTILSVLLGWVHLPRELRGQAPVRMEPVHARRLFLLFMGAELAVQVPLFFLLRHPSITIAAQVAQMAVVFAYYFRHRHLLVVHADNVGQLLQDARAELARQNEILAERLAQQERELLAKGEVIDRQRRLELAGQTAGQVAHDIQNLVAPALASEDLGEIRKRVNDILQLNTQLLALSRRGRAETVPVPLADLARDIAGRFPKLAVEIDGAPWTRGSWSQLARAVSNLVTNAFESGHDGPAPILLRTGVAELAQSRRCHLGFLPPGRYAVVEVADRGRGIPPMALDRVFEPFFSSKSGPRGSGSGLGLSIVAAVVDDHKGVVDLETGPGGTRFSLYFPAIEPAAERLSCSATVLVVDDDKATLQEYDELLPRHGWTVLSATNGADALRVLQAQEVDVLLLDLRMPGLDGLETFFGALHTRPGVGAVVHSGHVTEEQARKLGALGVSAILAKPAGGTPILRALRDAVESKRRD